MYKAKVKNLWKKDKAKIGFAVPISTIFRLLSFNNFKFKNKKILDIGFYDGSNLSEFKKRGADVYGVDINSMYIKSFLKKNKINKNKFKEVDCNYKDFFFKVKFDLITSTNQIVYLTNDRILSLLKNINKHLKQNGIFLLGYPQVILTKKKKIGNFEFFLNKSNYKITKKYVQKNNPVRNLNSKFINSVIQKSGFKVISSIFDIETYSKSEASPLIINRYFILKKKSVY